MSTFVLVHGGWHGGWCWHEVAARLRARGHTVYAPTLTGLAERAHLIDAVTGPDTHVDDIVGLIAWEDLRDITMVGHSYGGMIISGAATRMPDRVAHLAYLDAFVPIADHMSAQDMSIPSRREEMAAAPRDAHGNLMPNGFERWVSDPDTLAWLKTRTTPHPAACFGKGVSRVTDPSTLPVRRSFILCGGHVPSPFWQFYDRYKDHPDWTCHVMDCLHDAMIEEPDQLCALLAAKPDPA